MNPEQGFDFAAVTGAARGISAAMVGVTKIQRGNANYWLSAVAEGGEDYYTKPGEAPGQWIGELAEELGLAGQVDAAGYGAILEGRDPATGRTLLERPETRFRERPDGTQKAIEPVLGYDVRFSAPKSVSLLYALSSEHTQKRIVAVVNEAVRQGIAHLEAEACMVQRGKGGARIERGQGFVGMAFRHRMSRAGDPALHVHVLISNLTRAAADGKWLSLASPKGRSPLFPHGKSAGVVFQAALRAGFLREFGLEFGEIRNGYADIKGFGRELIEVFSTRSREIKDWLEKHGVSSVAAAQTAAYRTREAKDHGIDVDQRVTEWEARAEPFGLTRQSAEAMVTQARPREPLGVDDSVLVKAVDQLQKTSSHFDRRALLWAIADQLPEGADLNSLTAAADRALASDLVVRIYKSTGLLDPDAFSTPRILEAERSFVEGALSAAGADAGVVDGASLNRALAAHEYLGEDQREMVIRLTQGGERVVAVAARPGTGKTTALRATVEAWRGAGFPVIGCATARSATGELIDAGVRPSLSIAALRYQVKSWKAAGRGLPEATVIVVDEANVTNTFDLEMLRRLVVECGGKLVLIGDPRQIGAIGPGGLFVHTARVLDAVELTTIRRQPREADQRIVNLVHEGRGSEALDLLRDEGKLIVGEDIIETLNGLVLDWYADYASGADAVMIARRNRDVDFLNERAREILREEGKLGRREILVGERPISRGERVLTRINNCEVDNRERWDVVSVNPITRSVKLRRVGGDGRVVKLRRDYLERRTRDGAPALQPAYAITKFGAESKTFDRAYPLLDSGADLNQELVALSRGREVANVYTVASSELLDPDLGPARREIADVLQDVRETIERDGADFPAFEAPLRRGVDALSPAELAERRARLAEAGHDADPRLQRRRRLEEAIERDRGWAETLAAERAEAEALPEPLPTDLARLTAAEVSTAERIKLNIAERDALPEPVSCKVALPSPAERLEAALIAQRIERDTSRGLALARAGESKIIFDHLGPFPVDPGSAAEWERAAHALLRYRLRHDVRDLDNPLGREAASPAARAERAATANSLRDARRRLGLTHEIGVERSASRTIEIGR
ncbi:MAG TPA: MobF family relaxase [Solirubrobacterales bacterium]|nr:MobF family relaxase [Solirubrobacterales bacterium]